MRARVEELRNQWEELVRPVLSAALELAKGEPPEWQNGWTRQVWVVPDFRFKTSIMFMKVGETYMYRPPLVIKYAPNGELKGLHRLHQAMPFRPVPTANNDGDTR